MAQELNIRLNTEDKSPLYRQIYEYIRKEVRCGNLEAGERLPSTRALASSLHVARSTADLAYSQLVSEGYIRSKKNSGYYVNEIENLAELTDPSGQGLQPLENEVSAQGDKHACQSMPGFSGYAGSKAQTDSARSSGKSVPSLTSLGRQGAAEEGLIDFSLRHTEMSAFPYSTWKRIMREVMASANSEIFSHSQPGGDLSLRTTIARYLHLSRGVVCSPDQVIVGAGNDYLLMLLRHILGEGRRVAMENPSYLRAAQIFSSFRYRICPVRMDEDGMLPASVTESGADLVYAMPAHQFPLGCVMPVGRRAALMGWAAEAPDRYIIEDDYDSEFRYRGRPIPALQSLDRMGRVIYIGTFSKAIAPAIRVSYMILPPALLDKYHRECWFFSSTVSRIDQRILNEFMKNGHFERHLNRMRSLYRARHDELLACLRPFQDRLRIRGAGTGLHLVLEILPGALDEAGLFGEAGGERDKTEEIEKRMVRLARMQGVAVYPLSDYLLPGSRDGAGRRLPALLLGFGALDEASIREGVQRLAQALFSETEKV